MGQSVRYKCKNCGNTALFVFKHQAVVESVRMWIDTETGYVEIPSTQPFIKSVKNLNKPTQCWVCESKNIGYAHTVKVDSDDKT